MELDVELENPCATRKDFCINCHSHFNALRPLIKSVAVSKRFIKDFKDEQEAKLIIKDILDCSNIDFNELHKFEENVKGNLVFRAKTRDIHVVYCVDKKMRIVFLRAFKNYSEYREFLEDKKEIKKTIASCEARRAIDRRSPTNQLKEVHQRKPKTRPSEKKRRRKEREREREDPTEKPMSTGDHAYACSYIRLRVSLSSGSAMLRPHRTQKGVQDAHVRCLSSEFRNEHWGFRQNIFGSYIRPWG
jgi:mRNA-degrading endonuclease RelE of RelBE toxin-antitoxin system